MCGIFGYVRKNTGGSDPISASAIYEAFDMLKNRGPDRSAFQNIKEYGIEAFLGFQRLSIMDTSTKGDQPFVLEYGHSDEDKRTIYAICNGEIYNHVQISKEYDFECLLRGGSDCEFIPHMYAKYGIEKLCNELRGEFAIAILDINRTTEYVTLHLVRDATSVRPLFIGEDDRGFCFASEMKGISSIVDQTKIRQLRGGHRYSLKLSPLFSNDEFEFNKEDVCYFDLTKYILFEKQKIDTDKDDEYAYEITDMLEKMYPDLNEEQRIEKLEEILKNIREKFEHAVVSSMQSDVPIGTLLSGGLDSSLTSSIMARELLRNNKGRGKLRTFSIGMPGSTDKEFAEMVAKHIGSEHTHVEFSQEEFISAIPDVIRAIESYDITTVRASTGQYLISKWIRENTDVKVLSISDYSDEYWNGYMGVFYGKTPDAVHNDSISRMLDIGYFDSLRSDRGIANNGIEARAPFANRDLVQYVMELDPRLKVPLKDTYFGNKCPKRREKWLLRKAFEGSYLPEAVLWRPKEAMSDGISSKEKSWYKVIQENVEDRYSQADIDTWVETLAKSDTKCSPWTKEAVYYLELFTKYYGKAYQVIPYYWQHSFITSNKHQDPSARTLSVYNE